jgi:hypothetical protein
MQPSYKISKRKSRMGVLRDCDVEGRPIYRIYYEEAPILEPTKPIIIMSEAGYLEDLERQKIKHSCATIYVAMPSGKSAAEPVRTINTHRLEFSHDMIEAAFLMPGVKERMEWFYYDKPINRIMHKQYVDVLQEAHRIMQHLSGMMSPDDAMSMSNLISFIFVCIKSCKDDINHDTWKEYLADFNKTTGINVDKIIDVSNNSSGEKALTNVFKLTDNAAKQLSVVYAVMNSHNIDIWKCLSNAVHIFSYQISSEMLSCYAGVILTEMNKPDTHVERLNMLRIIANPGAFPQPNYSSVITRIEFNISCDVPSENLARIFHSYAKEKVLRAYSDM